MNDGFQHVRSPSKVFYNPETHARIVVHGDEFTFAATESELRKMRSRMCEWYGVKLRGILGSGRRDVREIEIRGRSLRWTEEGKHRQALLGGMGLSEESKVVHSAAVKPEEFGQEGDATMLGEAERKKFRSSVATLNYMSLD